jgi:hypothetical protein
MVPEIPVPQPRDSIGSGVGLAILCQIGSIVITIPIFCICWGAVQWLALVPIYISRKRRGFPLAAKGVLITGFIGMFLNAGCAALILGNLGNMH